MNKRIKELAEQAGFVLWTDEVNAISGETIDWSSSYDQEMVKYTELIINEIGKIVSGLIVEETFEKDIGSYEHWNRALGTVALEIEQHFYGDAHERKD
jgi:hypothetical protein